MQATKLAALLLLLISVTCCMGSLPEKSTTVQPLTVKQGISADAATPADSFLKLERYGARGDGSDDTKAFLAAHAVIQSRGYGGIVLQPGKTYGINFKAGGVLFKLTNLSSYAIDAGGGATIRDLSTYQRGESAIAFRFAGCRNIRIGGGLRLVTQEYSPGSNKTGLTWFEFVSGCKGIEAVADIEGGLHGFHFYRNYGEPQSASTADIKLAIRAKQVFYPELHERSGDHVVTTIDATNCGRAFFIFGGGNNVRADITTRNSFGFLISSDSVGNGAENIVIDYRDTDSDRGNSVGGRCGIQFYNQRPAVLRNIKISLDVRNNDKTPAYDTFFIYKVSDTGAQDKVGRGHKLYNLEVSGISSHLINRKHICTYGAFASPDIVSNVKISNFKADGDGSDILLSFGNALADAVTIENVAFPKNMIRILHSTGKVVFTGRTDDTYR